MGITWWAANLLALIAPVAGLGLIATGLFMLHRKRTQSGSLMILSGFAFLVLSWTIFPQLLSTQATQPVEEMPANHIAFECDGEQSIDGSFYTDGSAELAVYTGARSSITARYTLFDQGSHYLSDDEAVEFWIEGDEAMTTYLKENGVVKLKCTFLTFIHHGEGH